MSCLRREQERRSKVVRSATEEVDVVDPVQMDRLAKRWAEAVHETGSESLSRVVVIDRRDTRVPVIKNLRSVEGGQQAVVLHSVFLELAAVYEGQPTFGTRYARVSSG